MAEQSNNNLQNGVEKQEKEVRALFEKLILAETLTTKEEAMAAYSADGAPMCESGELGRFNPPKMMFIEPLLADNSDEDEEMEEDDVFPEMLPLVMGDYEDKDVDEDVSAMPLPDVPQPAGPTVHRNPFSVLWAALCDNVVLVGDRFGEVVRKSIFWLSLVVCIGALTYILYNVWWLPAYTQDMYQEIGSSYQPDLIGTVGEGDYPSQMQLSFQMLYDRNPEVRGWLSYHASGNRDFLNVDYPIMYSGDNDKYLTTDFNGNKNKNGALFFDMRSRLESPEDENRVLIAYGHNMASGQMLAGMNKLIGNVNNARTAATLSMNTLFRNGEYKVFAVVMTDEDATGKQYFNVRRTQFHSDEDFLRYVESLRERSLFDYPVDVQAEDELLLLSTCTAPSSAKISNGRLTVIARRVREGESSNVNTAAIVRNEDVIMPYAWYTKQSKLPHAYYTGASTTVMADTTTTTTVAPSGTSTTQETVTTTTAPTTTGTVGSTTTKTVPHTTTTTAGTTAAPTTTTTATTSTTAVTTTTTTAAETSASTSAATTTASTAQSTAETTTASITVPFESMPATE